MTENHLSAWDELVGTLALLPSSVSSQSQIPRRQLTLASLASCRLQRLVLSRNDITRIPTIASSSTLSIRHLYLTANALTSWSSVDALNSQLPGLIGLWISENPLFDGMYEEDVRLEIIARVKGLTELEGSRVSGDDLAPTEDLR